MVGTAMGLGSSIGLLGFALGPVSGGALFASTQDLESLPWIMQQGRFFFWFIMVVVIANLCLTTTLPKCALSLPSFAVLASPAFA